MLYLLVKCLVSKEFNAWHHRVCCTSSLAEVITGFFIIISVSKTWKNPKVRNWSAAWDCWLGLLFSTQRKTRRLSSSHILLPVQPWDPTASRWPQPAQAPQQDTVIPRGVSSSPVLDVLLRSPRRHLLIGSWMNEWFPAGKDTFIPSPV